MHLTWTYPNGRTYPDHAGDVPLRLKVTREKGDPRIKGGEFGSAESALLGRIRRALNDAAALGDPARCLPRGDGAWICKRMWRDGHMVEESQRYVRMRRPTSRGVLLAIYSGEHLIRDAGRSFNENGEFSFLVADIGGKR